ncbi:unnamed protein product [Cylindrotheca closterium]|uniref:PDZ domain-containing protein n=1 Tax=Cylindrotheca closterium TaxID=2856 RepID=A0AAD2CCP5_9STRA|nr:unnamed protein product [Cylindrotheca closterium]
MSSEDYTKTVVLKRSAKKKSGYAIVEKEGEYFVDAIPPKARVNEGDKVVGINGITSDEFVDEDDANDLIESIRIVVVPEDQIADYEAAKEAEDAGEVAGEESSEEEYEEVQRPRGKGKKKAAPAAAAGPTPESALVVRDEEDEEADQVYPCPECGFENVNPERDEDGDLACEECGGLLEAVLTCPGCGYGNVNPEPDEEGDYVCAECGEILEVKDLTRAERLKAMHNEVAETTADGQTFGADGKPKTNQEGKKLTPADMFSPGDVITVTVGKSNPKQDAGLKVEEVNGKYYVRKIPASGLFAKTPVAAGDKVLELNGTDSKGYPTLNDMKKTIKDEQRITIVVLRRDPDASYSSADSDDIDYDNLAPVAPPDSDEDNSTVGYDGQDCGTVWCPHCHPEYAEGNDLMLEE